MPTDLKLPTASITTGQPVAIKEATMTQPAQTFILGNIARARAMARVRGDWVLDDRLRRTARIIIRLARQWYSGQPMTEVVREYLEDEFCTCGTRKASAGDHAEGCPLSSRLSAIIEGPDAD